MPIGAKTCRCSAIGLLRWRKRGPTACAKANEMTWRPLCPSVWAFRSEMFPRPANKRRVTAGGPSGRSSWINIYCCRLAQSGYARYLPARAPKRLRPLFAVGLRPMAPAGSQIAGNCIPALIAASPRSSRLEGKSLAYADPNSTSRYLVPRFELNALVSNDEEFSSPHRFGGVTSRPLWPCFRASTSARREPGPPGQGEASEELQPAATCIKA